MTYVYRVKPFLRVLPQSLYGIPFCMVEGCRSPAAEMRTLITSAVLRLGGLYNTRTHFYCLHKSLLDDMSFLSSVVDGCGKWHEGRKRYHINQRWAGCSFSWEVAQLKGTLMLSVLIKLITSSGLRNSFESLIIARTLKVLQVTSVKTDYSLTGFLNECDLMEHIPLCYKRSKQKQVKLSVRTQFIFSFIGFGCLFQIKLIHHQTLIQGK